MGYVVLNGKTPKTLRQGMERRKDDSNIGITRHVLRLQTQVCGCSRFTLGAREGEPHHSFNGTSMEESSEPCASYADRTICGGTLSNSRDSSCNGLRMRNISLFAVHFGLNTQSNCFESAVQSGSSLRCIAHHHSSLTSSHAFALKSKQFCSIWDQSNLLILRTA